MEEKKKEKESFIVKLVKIDADYDLVRVKKWPPFLRWICLLPAGFLTALVVFIAIGWIVNFLGRNITNPWLLAPLDALYTWFIFFCIIQIMMGMAPVKNKWRFYKVMVGFVLLLFVGLVYLALAYSLSGGFDMTYAIYSIALRFIAVDLACVNVFLDIRSKMKAKETEIR